MSQPREPQARDAEIAEAASWEQLRRVRSLLVVAQGEIDDRDREIAELRDALADKEGQLEERDTVVARQDDYIRRLTRFRRRLPHPLRRALGRGKA